MLGEGKGIFPPSGRYHSTGGLPRQSADCLAMTNRIRQILICRDVHRIVTHAIVLGASQSSPGRGRLGERSFGAHHATPQVSINSPPSHIRSVIYHMLYKTVKQKPSQQAGQKLELLARFELATSSLPRMRSTD